MFSDHATGQPGSGHNGTIILDVFKLYPFVSAACDEVVVQHGLILPKRHYTPRLGREQLQTIHLYELGCFREPVSHVPWSAGYSPTHRTITCMSTYFIER